MQCGIAENGVAANGMLLGLSDEKEDSLSLSADDGRWYGMFS